MIPISNNRLMNLAGFISSWSIQEVVLLVLTAFFSFVVARRLTSTGPPTVGWIPYIGCWYEFYADPPGFLLKVREKYGDVVNVYMGGVTMTYVFDEKYLSTFYKTAEDRLSFSKPFQRSGTMAVVDPNDNRASMEGPKAKQITAGIMGVLKQKFVPKLSSFVPLFQPEIDSYLDEAFASETGIVSSRELYIQLVGRMSTRVLCGSDLAKNQQLINTEYELAELLREATQTMKCSFDRIRKKSKGLHSKLDSILMEAIKQRRKWQAEDPEIWTEKHNCDDLMSTYMNAFSPKDGMSKEQKHGMDQICLASKNFLFAAMVNTTQGTQYTLLRILADPKLKEAVVKEIDDVLREDGGEIKGDSVKKLRLLDACFLEHARIVSGWRQMREVVNKPIILPNGFVLPIGSIVAISPWIQAHSGKNFDSPDKYYPQRMIDGLPKSSDYTYLAFGAGKHKCLGMPMAQMESQLCIAALLKNYDMEIVRGDDGVLLPEPDYPKGTLALPKRDVQLKYTKRKTPLGQ